MFKFLFTFFSLSSLLCTAENLSWQSSEYIWNFGIAQACNKGLNRNPQDFFAADLFDKRAYLQIQKNDLVWVKSRFVSDFYYKVLPTVRNPFILIISDGDESFPSNSNLAGHVEEFVNHEKIIHIFTQNFDYSGPSKKVSPLPIGIDFHTQAYKSNASSWGGVYSVSEQEAALKKIQSGLKPTGERKPRAFVDFQLNDSMVGCFHRDQQFGENRTTIFERLKKTGLIDFGDKMKRFDLWKTKGEYAFSISPVGNGLDCHRTWEDLVLGCIVIVKSTSIDPLFEGLPVVIVKDWSEITEENLLKWREKYKDAFTNPEYRKKLTCDYWLNVIRSKKLF